MTALIQEFKPDLNTYLAGLAAKARPAWAS